MQPKPGDQKEEIFGQGQVLFRQGEKGRDLFFVIEGQIELEVKDEATGKSAVVATLGPRNVLGSMSFLEGVPRSATATAATEVKVVRVKEGQRDKLLKEVPAWLQVLIKDLATNLRRINGEYTKLKSDHDALAKKLDHFKAKDGKES